MNETSNGIPQEVLFFECKGAGTRFDWPGETGPGEHPPGWEQRQVVGSTVILYMMECERVSWGPFERPLRFLIEMHSKETPPEKCADREGVDGVLSINILQSLWLEDQQVADYLKGIYGLPVVLGTFDVTSSIQNGVGNITWRWTPLGGETSSVTYYVFNHGGNSYSSPDTERLVWYNETQLSYLDLRIEPLLDQVSPGLTSGTMKPPMLHATKGSEAYAGTGQKYDDIRLSGKIKRFGNYSCTDPLP